MQVKPLLQHQNGGVEDAWKVTGIGETSELASLSFPWEHKTLGTIVPIPGHMLVVVLRVLPVPENYSFLGNWVFQKYSTRRLHVSVRADTRGTFTVFA